MTLKAKKRTRKYRKKKYIRKRRSTRHRKAKRTHKKKYTRYRKRGGRAPIISNIDYSEYVQNIILENPQITQNTYQNYNISPTQFQVWKNHILGQFDGPTQMEMVNDAEEQLLRCFPHSIERISVFGNIIRTNTHIDEDGEVQEDIRMFNRTLFENFKLIELANCFPV